MFPVQRHNLCFLCGERASAPDVDRCTSCRFLWAAARPGLRRLLQILAVYEFEACAIVVGPLASRIHP